MATHRISPEVDQDRFYLLQDLIMSGAASRFGYVQGVGTSTMPDPRAKLGGDPYVTDGLRLERGVRPSPRDTPEQTRCRTALLRLPRR
jgi:hypothetical protein